MHRAMKTDMEKECLYDVSSCSTRLGKTGKPNQSAITTINTEKYD